MYNKPDLKHLFEECIREQRHILMRRSTTDSIIYIEVAATTYLLMTGDYISRKEATSESFPHLNEKWIGECICSPDDFFIFPIAINNEVAFGKAMIQVELKF